jgi:uncharacterized protein (TIGR03067 family)
MSHRLLVAALLVVAGALPEKSAEAELRKLQGNWRVAAVEVDGRVTPAEAEYTLAVSGDKITQTVLGRKLTGTVRIDPQAKPKTIDLVWGPDDTTLGVYELDGDVLKVCEARPGGKRPTAVSGKAGGGLVTAYKRAKP